MKEHIIYKHCKVCHKYFKSINHNAFCSDQCKKNYNIGKHEPIPPKPTAYGGTEKEWHEYRKLYRKYDKKERDAGNRIRVTGVRL